MLLLGPASPPALPRFFLSLPALSPLLLPELTELGSCFLRSRQLIAVSFPLLEKKQVSYKDWTASFSSTISLRKMYSPPAAPDVQPTSEDFPPCVMLLPPCLRVVLVTLCHKLPLLSWKTGWVCSDLTELRSTPWLPVLQLHA